MSPFLIAHYVKALWGPLGSLRTRKGLYKCRPFTLFFYHLLWSTCDLLFSRDVALTYWSAIHFSHLHITLNLPKVQSQVLTMDSHKCATFPGASQRGDLLEMMIMNII